MEEAPREQNWFLCALGGRTSLGRRGCSTQTALNYIDLLQVSLQSPVFLLPEQQLAQKILTSQCLILPLYVFLWDSERGANDQITQFRGH